MSRAQYGFVYRWGEAALRTGLTREYALGLKWVLRHQKTVLVITVADVCAQCVPVCILVPKGFFPQMDAGRISGQVRGQQDVSFGALMAG